MFSGTCACATGCGSAGDGSGRSPRSSVFDGGAAVPACARVAAGQIAKLWGLADVRIGDAIGGPRDGRQRPPLRPADARDGRRAPPTPPTGGALHIALAQLAEQDPLIDLRQDDVRQRALRLALRRGAEGGHPGDAGRRLRRRGRVPRDDDDLHRAAGRHRRGRRDHRTRTRTRSSRPSGCAIEPAPVGSGIAFRLEVELGSMPLRVLHGGRGDRRARRCSRALHGWQVTDCAVTMTHSGYWATPEPLARGRSTRACRAPRGDFRNLTPLVLMERAAGRPARACYEPIAPLPARAPGGRARPGAARARRGSRAVPRRAGDARRDAACSRARSRRRGCTSCASSCRALTRGEGVLESAFDRYEPVRGAIPSRPRTDHDPLDREEYLRRVRATIGSGHGSHHRHRLHHRPDQGLRGRGGVLPRRARPPGVQALGADARRRVRDRQPDDRDHAVGRLRARVQASHRTRSSSGSTTSRAPRPSSSRAACSSGATSSTAASATRRSSRTRTATRSPSTTATRLSESAR